MADGIIYNADFFKNGCLVACEHDNTCPEGASLTDVFAGIDPTPADSTLTQGDAEILKIDYESMAMLVNRLWSWYTPQPWLEHQCTLEKRTKAEYNVLFYDLIDRLKGAVDPIASIPLNNGMSLVFHSVENFDPQVPMGQVVDMKAVGIAGVINDAAELGFRTSLLADNLNTPENEGLFRLKAFIVDYCSRNPGVLEKLGITDLKRLTPRQAMLLSCHIAIERIAYSHSQMLGGMALLRPDLDTNWSRGNEARINDTIPLEDLLARDSGEDGNGVCRNYSQAVMGLLEALKAMQEPGESRLSTTFCIDNGGEGYDFYRTQPPIPGFVNYHAWNSFITIEGDTIHTLVVDTTFADENGAKLTVRKDLPLLDFTAERLNVVIHRFQGAGLVDPEDIIAGLTQAYQGLKAFGRPGVILAKVLQEMSASILLDAEDVRTANTLLNDYFAADQDDEDSKYWVRFFSAMACERMRAFEDSPEACRYGVMPERMNEEVEFENRYGVTIGRDYDVNEDEVPLDDLRQAVSSVHLSLIRGMWISFDKTRDDPSDSIDRVTLLITDDPKAMIEKIVQRARIRQKWQGVQNKYMCDLQMTGSSSYDNDTWLKFIDSVDSFFSAVPEYKYRYRTIDISEFSYSITGVHLLAKDFFERDFAKLENALGKRGADYESKMDSLESLRLFHILEMDHREFLKGIMLAAKPKDVKEARMWKETLETALKNEKVLGAIVEMGLPIAISLSNKSVFAGSEKRGCMTPSDILYLLPGMSVKRTTEAIINAVRLRTDYGKIMADAKWELAGRAEISVSEYVQLTPEFNRNLARFLKYVCDNSADFAFRKGLKFEIGVDNIECSFLIDDVKIKSYLGGFKSFKKELDKMWADSKRLKEGIDSIKDKYGVAITNQRPLGGSEMVLAAKHIHDLDQVLDGIRGNVGAWTVVIESNYNYDKYNIDEASRTLTYYIRSGPY